MLRTPPFSGKPFILKEFFLLSTVICIQHMIDQHNLMIIMRMIQKSDFNRLRYDENFTLHETNVKKFHTMKYNLKVFQFVSSPVLSFDAKPLKM